MRWSLVKGTARTPRRSGSGISIGFSGGGASFTCVGNAAPPRPTMPASRTAASSCLPGRPRKRVREPRQALVPLVFSVVFNHDAVEHSGRSRAARCSIPAHDARDGCVHRRAHVSGGLAHLLPPENPVALLNQRLAGRARRAAESAIATTFGTAAATRRCAVPVSALAALPLARMHAAFPMVYIFIENNSIAHGHPTNYHITRESIDFQPARRASFA